jgi:nicotinamide-nucleotide amidase
MKLLFAEVITIGDEILYGQITDTNTQWISTELDKIGIKLIRKSSVGDQEKNILDILTESSQRADIIIMTGGLGPTKDDITKKTLCKFFDDVLVRNDHAFAFVKDFFEKRGREFTDINQQQALLPSKATYLFNKTGTAPGIWINENGKIFVSMPGVPHEMKYLMANEVIPRLQSHFKTPVIYHKIIRTVGIGESFLAEKIETWEDALPGNIKLAYLPSFGQVRLRLTATGEDLSVLENQVQIEIDKVFPLIANEIFSLENEDFEQAIGRQLNENNETLAIAESCTGGYVSHLITKVAGSSIYFMGSIIAYSYEAKVAFLGVKQETLDAEGAVSKQTVTEMAEGVRKKMGTTYGIATTGVAGPGGGTDEKPVGTIWIACAGPDKTIATKLMMTQQRETNIQYGAYSVLNLLRKMINKHYK